MKFRFTLLYLTIICTIKLNSVQSQATNVQDSLALVNLYNSTNGANWYFNNNWLTINPVSTWDGVTVSNSRVTKLQLSNTNLTGTLPSSLGNLTALTYLSLGFNSITGSIPSSVGNLVQLQALDLLGNQLSGSIPSSIGNLTALTSIYLNNNALSSSIPSSIGNLVNLVVLSLGNNSLSGSIPSSIGNLVNLTDFYLFYNQLTGPIPASLGNCTKINYFYLSYNSLSDTIPSSLGNLSKLFTFQVQHNQLTGEIPLSLFKLKKLGGIDVSFNHLTQTPNPNFPPIKKRSLYLNLNANAYTFDGLEYAVRKFDNVQYYIEESLPLHKNGNTISVYAGGTLSNNTYTWYNSSGAVVADITGDSTFTPVTSGSYYVSVKNKIAKLTPINSDTINFIISPVAKSTNNASAALLSTKLMLYPNPASNAINVQYKGEAEIVITNASGKTVMAKKINGNTSINITSLAPGVYYLQNITSKQKQQFIIAR